MQIFRLVLMDRHPHPEHREYRVCAVEMNEAGDVTWWQPETLLTGETQEELHGMHAAMHGAFYLPVLRETELPDAK